MSDQNVVLSLNPEEVKQFFFKGMQHGYASGVKPVKNKPFAGWNMHEYVNGDLILRDMWLSVPVTFNSCGITTIHWRGIPVWSMQYGGWYHDQAIKTLQSALWKAYEELQFIGGRGPRLFETNHHRYINRVASNDFTSFSGIEEVKVRDSGKELGNHWYKGEWLLTH